MSEILLGNLSVIEIENRLGIKFPDELVKYLNKNRQEIIKDVVIGSGKWHCYDMPFKFVCGDKETAAYVYNQLKKYSHNMKTKMIICVQIKRQEVK